MQDSPVRLKPEAGQDIAFLLRRIIDQFQRLVGMGRHDDLVKPDIALTVD